ncbi:Retrovirus-related Pol polyprotein from transposon 297 [Eumeta japonica]|uniref:Retrovirus-related Pol polyprotein from transposon 297 n=1 Tax=Eumeta variegata TaxID=151549 RepID=A0A4C1ZQZ7_EUMVA|nr:Retrovirus-related Pol polyprotein from transposon 297 [Eumeta japonica]
MQTLKDYFPLPLITDQIDKLGKSQYFTCLDMTAGFHGIPIAPDSIEKTAFITPDGQFEYLHMPFGLCNASFIYQRAINSALGDYKDKIALVYVDDILVTSQTI